jgi:pyruvate/oxaloacetate carboxyltransferase
MYIVKMQTPKNNTQQLMETIQNLQHDMGSKDKHLAQIKTKIETIQENFNIQKSQNEIRIKILQN